jgi:hypothetical protein
VSSFTPPQSTPPQFTPLVFLKLTSQLIPVWVYPDAVQGTAINSTVYFSSTDCTGQAAVYIDPTAPITILQLTYVVGPQRSVYISNGTPSPFSVGSVLEASSPDCLVQTFSTVAAPATKLADIGSQFTPPFRAVAH